MNESTQAVPTNLLYYESFWDAFIPHMYLLKVAHNHCSGYHQGSEEFRNLSQASGVLSVRSKVCLRKNIIFLSYSSALKALIKVGTHLIYI